MANQQNLKQLSPSEAREQGRKGGKASAESRRRKKSLKEAALAILEVVRNNPDTGEQENGFEAVAAALVLKASAGDISAINSLRDLIGEKPTDKVQLDGNIEVIFDIPRPKKVRTKKDGNKIANQDSVHAQ